MTPHPGKAHFEYCRPHVKTITPQMQFVVQTCRGIDTGERQFAPGDEFPADAVNEYNLRCLYEQLKIELMPEEHPAYRSRPALDPKELDSLNHKQLQELCVRFALPVIGSKAELRKQLLALVPAE